jgi:nucleotide-binding universal stress UspA family protein
LNAEGGVVLTFLALWVGVVALTVVIMARRGHSWFSWAVLGGALGPLAWPLALRELAADRRADEPDADGDVLIAVAPWERSPEPILGSLGRVRPPARTATLVTVLDAEDATTPAGRAIVEAAEARLRSFAVAVSSSGLVAGPVEHRVRYGRAADELARLARAGGFEWIVLGSGGSRTQHLLHGRTRTRLERLIPVPVVRTERERVAV